MLYNTKALIDKGLIKPPPHVQFVLGIPNALPARREVLEFGISELAELMPGATWTAAGIGRHQLDVAKWCLELGGHVRTGLEDNLKYDRTRLANSNAELVTQIVDACPEFDRHPASVDEARKIMGLTRPHADGNEDGVQVFNGAHEFQPVTGDTGDQPGMKRRDHVMAFARRQRCRIFSGLLKVITMFN